MKIKDKEVLKHLKTVRCCDLEESISTLPDDEKCGRTDMEILKDELDYFLGLYEEGGTCHSEDLEQAREFMKETKKGTVIPCWNTIPPMPKYSTTQLEIRLQQARNTINEYNRLVSLAKRLKIR